MPNEEIELQRLLHVTSFNLNELGYFESNVVAEKNETLNEKKYGASEHSRLNLTWSYDELQKHVKHAKIEVKWVQNEETYKETIIARFNN
ncbi:hypothetical protein BEP19_04065 [Ammoniphilus oxalaticus]|uniref:Uncharacterized protein n=1 Tax=Ammoniphilus oxalaticus TaxID=66863 RepID=A0A419SLS5_9BACL|nr:hypothetical protein [Ammoniphilus oxalaticus]RKD25011.1 hypothetical protein BEP19_04065 [Ammoniphilus oxalaticus]